MKKYFINKEFDEKLRKAFELLNEKRMTELEEEMKKKNIDYTFSEELEEK